MLQQKGKGQKRKAGFSWWFVIFDDLANIESIAQFSKKMYRQSTFVYRNWQCN
jgi:hypothetical protein